MQIIIMNDGKGDDKLTGCSIKEFPDAHGMLHDFVEGKMTMIANDAYACLLMNFLVRRDQGSAGVA